MNDNEPMVYVVDDDEDSRDSACALISQMKLRVQAFGSAKDFLERYDGYRPGCLLTDHRMPGMSGVELLEALRSQGMTLSVVVMTAYAETPLTVRAIRSGAVTLLEKPFSKIALFEAIEKSLNEDRRQNNAEQRVARIHDRLATLSESEQEVLKQIVRGETNKAVAYNMRVSIRTVESRRSSIFEKMGVSSVAELVQLVMIARSREFEDGLQ